MRTVTLYARVDPEKCPGCVICKSVCPTVSITLENRLAVIDLETCSGCGACEQRCPTEAITLQKRDEPKVLHVDVGQVDYARVCELCARAHLHPEQVVCFCTTTRAEEVAAAIILGASTPEDLSRQVGLRTGCKVECIQPALRLLEAAGKDPGKAPGWQWYGRTVTAWEIPEGVKAKYSKRGFYFDEDVRLLSKVVDATGAE